MSSKHRLSASVDASVMAAAQAAVSDGRATNISAWVNEALHRQAENDLRMRALGEFLLAYEAEHGVITEAEIRGATSRARSRAVVVRGKGTARVSERKPQRRAGAR